MGGFLAGCPFLRAICSTLPCVSLQRAVVLETEGWQGLLLNASHFTWLGMIGVIPYHTSLLLLFPLVGSD